MKAQRDNTQGFSGGVRFPLIEEEQNGDVTLGTIQSAHQQSERLRAVVPHGHGLEGDALALLHNVFKHKELARHWQNGAHLSEMDLTGTAFPVKVTVICHLERQNPTIAVTCSGGIAGYIQSVSNRD